MSFVPHEFAIGGVFLPPMLIAGILATIVAYIISSLLNRYGLSKYLFYPPLVFVALVVIFTVLIGTIVIPS